MKGSLKKYLFYLLVILFCLISFFPIIWIALSSFKNSSELYVFPIEYIPNSITIQNYIDVFTKNQFGRYFLNSLFIASMTTVITITIAGLCAYALARLKFKTKGIVMIYVIAGSMLPMMARLIPLFEILKSLKLLNTYLGMIIVYVALTLPLAVMILMTFFAKIPDDLENAALVDGCTTLGAFVRIIVPLSAPGLATAGILTFIAAWNDFLIALTVITDPNMRTIPVGIAMYPGEYSFPWATISAAIVIAVIPIVLFILFLQKRIITGLTAGGVKG